MWLIFALFPPRPSPHHLGALEQMKVDASGIPEFRKELHEIYIHSLKLSAHGQVIFCCFFSVFFFKNVAVMCGSHPAESIRRSLFWGGGAIHFGTGTLRTWLLS